MNPIANFLPSSLTSEIPDVLVSKSAGYSGFIPNEALAALTPSQSIVYCTVQFLSFFSRKVTPLSISGRITGMSRSTIRNCLLYLRSNGYIRREGDTYEFRNHKLDRSKDYLTARELSDIHLGYFVPLNILESYRLRPTDKITLVVIGSIIKSQSGKCIDTEFIAKKIGRSSRAASVAINNLLGEGWISRQKRSLDCPFYYQLGVQDMSKHKPFSISYDMSLDNEAGKPNPQPVGSFEERPEIDTPKRPEIDIPIPYMSYNRSIINKQDSRVSENERPAYELRKNNSLIFLKTMVAYFERQADLLGSRINAQEKTLNQQYTQACLDRDIDLMRELGSRMSAEERNNGRAEENSDKVVGMVQDYLYVAQGRNFAELRQTHISAVGKGVKDILPDFDSPILKKKAFCLLMNSVVSDLRLEFYQAINKTDRNTPSREEVAMQKAIKNCLIRASRSAYKINDNVAMDFYKHQEKEQLRQAKPDRCHWQN